MVEKRFSQPVCCEPQNRFLILSEAREVHQITKMSRHSLLLSQCSIIFPDNYATSSNSSRACVSMCVYLLVHVGGCVVRFAVVTVLQRCGFAYLVMCVCLFHMISFLLPNLLFVSDPSSQNNTFLFKGQYRSHSQARFLNSAFHIWK